MKRVLGYVSSADTIRYNRTHDIAYCGRVYPDQSYKAVEERYSRRSPRRLLEGVSRIVRDPVFVIAFYERVEIEPAKVQSCGREDLASHLLVRVQRTWVPKERT